jgi:hypothetical protein
MKGVTYKYMLLFVGYFLSLFLVNAQNEPIPTVKNSFVMPDTAKKNPLLYVLVDSNKLANRLLFYPVTFADNNEEETHDLKPQNIQMRELNKHLYLFFMVFILLLIVFSRFFPYQFKLQLFGFFNRSDQREMLAGSTGWIEGEKIFPLLVTILFIATWIVQPLLNIWVFETAYLIVIFVSFFILLIIFLLNRLFQIIFSYVLAFEFAMEYFTKSSFNSLFILAIIGFPLFTILHSLAPNQEFINPFNTLLIIGMLYIIRSIKSILTCLRFELRQIIYLIIYLCAFEIPILIISLKWISEKVII